MKTEDFCSLTATEIARLWGVTAQAVGMWVKRTGCPRNKEGTYDLPAVIKWRESQIGNNPKDEGVPAGYKSWPEYWTSEKKRLEVEQAQGKLLDAEEVREANEMKLISLTRGLENLEELAPHLEGLDARQIKATIRQRVRDLRMAYARGR